MAESNTVTFSINQSTSYSTGQTTLTIYLQNQIDFWQQYTAPDGTGFTRTEEWTETINYSSVTSPGNASYTVSDTRSDQVDMKQDGEDSVTGGEAVDDDWRNYTSNSQLQATVAGSVTVVTYTDGETGSDGYSHSVSVSPSAAGSQATGLTINDQLSGNDTWQMTMTGSFHQNADGTTTASNTSSDTESGNDLYDDEQTQVATSDGPTDDGSDGTTLMIDMQSGSDTGTDQYAVNSTETASRDVNGVVTTSGTHDDSDGGQENVDVSDHGTVETTETNADGSVMFASDDFHDSDDDNSSYGDSDEGTDSDDGDTDQSSDEEDDTDTFSSGDTSQVTLASTAATGAVTTVTITGFDTDSGTDTTHEDISDDESSSPSSGEDGGGETDDYTFDDSDDEEDTDQSGGTINITVEGLVAAGDDVSSNEEISLSDTTITKTTSDDPGTEEDTPTGDSEEDTLTSTSNVQDTLTVGDDFSSKETIAGTDGSVDTETDTDDSNETLVDTEGDESEDDGSATSGADGSDEIDTDNETDNGTSTITDESTDNSTSSSDVEQPVTNGTLETFQSSQSNSNDQTTDTGTDDSTEDSETSPVGQVSNLPSSSTDDSTEEYSDVGGGTSNSNNFSELNVTDPTTGIVTNVFTGGTGNDTSGSELSDDSSDDSTDDDGESTDESEEQAIVSGNDNFGDTDELNISVQGSPAPGMTVNYSAELNTTDEGDDEASGNITSDAAGDDEGSDTFENDETESLSGTSQSTVTNITNTNDGQGNTVNSTDTETDNGTIGGTASDDDDGSEDFADTDGQPTSDTEEDTDQGSGLAQASDHLTSSVSGTAVNVDPTSGLQSAISFADSATDDESNTEVDQDADSHTSSGVTDPATSDDESFDDKLTEGGQATDNETIGIATQGTDAQGAQINVQETIGLTANGTASSSDDDTGDDDVDASGAETGGDTETVDANVQEHAGITDTLNGTVVTIDPNTGIKTTTTDNISVTGTDDEDDHDDETDVRTQSGTAGSSENDTANQTNSSTLVINSSGTENVTETNPDGSSAGAPTNTTSSSTDSINASVNLSRAADGTTTTTPSGTETGSSTSSNPTIGSSTWSNQPLNQGSLNTLSSGVAVMSDVSAEAGGSGGSSGSGGGSTNSTSTSTTQNGSGLIDGMTRSEFIDKKINSLLANIQSLERQIKASSDPAFQAALLKNQKMWQDVLATEQAKLGIVQTAQNAGVLPPGEQIDMEAVGEPGFWESLIPIWGAARYSAARVEEGSYGRGGAWFLVAFFDVSLVRSAATALWKGGANLLGREAVVGGAKVGAEVAAKEAIPVVARKAATTFEEFMVGRTFGTAEEAQKAWEVYQRAGQAGKGLVIGHGDAPIKAAHDGWQAFRTTFWTDLINSEWIEGAVDAGLPVKLVTLFNDVVRGSVTWDEIQWVISRGGTLIP